MYNKEMLLPKTKTVFSYLVLIGLFLTSYRLVNRQKAYIRSMSATKKDFAAGQKSPDSFNNGRQ